jgi:hypothetical protein
MYTLVLRIVVGVTRRRVLAVRNGSNSLVVRASLTTPLLSDGGQDSPQRVRRLDVDVRGRVRSSLEILVERTGVA